VEGVGREGGRGGRGGRRVGGGGGGAGGGGWGREAASAEGAVESGGGRVRLARGRCTTGQRMPSVRVERMRLGDRRLDTEWRCRDDQSRQEPPAKAWNERRRVNNSSYTVLHLKELKATNWQGSAACDLRGANPPVLYCHGSEPANYGRRGDYRPCQPYLDESPSYTGKHVTDLSPPSPPPENPRAKT